MWGGGGWEYSEWIPCHWRCNDDRRIGITVRRFTAITDLATTLITALHKTGDCTIVLVVASIHVRNLQIIVGDGLISGLNDFWSGRVGEWGEGKIKLIGFFSRLRWRGIIRI